MLQPDTTITDEGNLLCSGGCNSYIDLSIYLIERYCGKAVALESSKAILHDPGRNSQLPYQVCQFSTDHNDSKIKSIQQWLADNYNQTINMSHLAENFGLSRRAFERRFKAATGNTPLLYSQRLRVEAAKQLLENGNMTFNEIAISVGYEDTCFFRKVFKKHTKLLPKEYKAKFVRSSPELDHSISLKFENKINENRAGK